MELYSTPEINDKLYLQYKGWSKVENMDEYTGLRCLWLEGNGLRRRMFAQSNIGEQSRIGMMRAT